MLTRKNFHTITANTKDCPPPFLLKGVKFRHENCGSEEVTLIYELPEHNINLWCRSCHFGFSLPDQSFFFSVFDNHQLFYYSSGNVLFVFNEACPKPTIELQPHTSNVIKVLPYRGPEKFQLHQILIRHECLDRDYPILSFDSNQIAHCIWCCRSFDFSNPDLLVAIFNASLDRITSEVNTPSGLVCSGPQKLDRYLR